MFEEITAGAAQGTLAITGRNSITSQVPSISFTLDQDIEPGVYEIDGVETVANYTRSFSEIFITDSGSVEITAHDTAANSIQGSFSFRGINFFTSDTVLITNGTLDIDYIE
jgi:hypothetical protein